VEAVPRAWTHLLATLTGEPLDPALPLPRPWRELAAERCPQRTVPARLTDGADASYRPWAPGAGAPDAVDRAILATRAAVFPLHGLDPADPRD
jgi:acetoin utilization protein AcuC